MTQNANMEDPSLSGVQSLDQACAELHRMVDAFRTKWLVENAKNPEHFPMHLTDGQWFENFLCDATGGSGL